MTEVIPPEPDPHHHEGEASILPFPFPFHLRRADEPLSPHLAPADFTGDRGELLDDWLTWVHGKPDQALLAIEYLDWEKWQRKWNTFSDEKLREIHEGNIREATKLRDQGHGDIIDNYWPHLNQPLSEE